MISAKDAKNIVNTPDVDKELKEVEKRILAAAKKQETQVWYYDELTPAALKKMRSLGYKVNQQYDTRENGWLVDIQW